MWAPCALCRGGGGNLEFEHHAVWCAGFFGRCSEHGWAKNFLGCTCLRSMLGKSTTAVHELQKFFDTATVDLILIEGDRLYFNALVIIKLQNTTGSLGEREMQWEPTMEEFIHCVFRILRKVYGCFCNTIEIRLFLFVLFCCFFCYDNVLERRLLATQKALYICCIPA